MNNNNITLLYVVRHGETEWNLSGKQQGHMDSPLTNHGIQQAYALAKVLQGRNIEFIYSSDLGRALKTAEIIGKSLSLSVKTEERLRERNLGTLQGLTMDEWQNQFPQEWKAFISGDPDYCFPNGESARQRYERTVNCVESIVKQHKNRTVLIVTHGGVLSGLFYRTFNIPFSTPRNFSLFNATINLFSVSNGNWRLDIWGEKYHLHGMELLDDT
ncbi:MAG: histidine phosphatase family protein [Chitinispirillia bacterium]|jgi:probable phosphoglycerate mutase